jgi:hypothetical protein
MSSIVSSIQQFLQIPKRSIHIINLCLLIIAGSYLYENIYERYLVNNWTILEPEYERTLANDIQAKFSEYQSETLAEVNRVAHSSIISAILSNHPDTSQSIFFEYLLSNSKHYITFELFDRKKQILAWIGNRGITTDTTYLTSFNNSSIVEGAIYSYLLISTPISQADRIVGYLVGKRLFDVNYPINNRFINSQKFSSTFTNRFTAIHSFNFDADSEYHRNRDLITVPLINLEGKHLGFGAMTKPIFSERLDSFKNKINSFNKLLLFLLVVVLVYSVIQKSRISVNAIHKIILFTIGLWLLRYSMVWFNLPQGLIHLSIFDAKDFASRFGFGIVRSLGDLCLSSIFLFINIINVANYFYSEDKWGLSNIPLLKLKNKIYAITIIAASTFIVLMLIRGYAAIVRSGVFDSAMSYSDLTSILPSVEFSVMLVSLILITGSFLITVAGLILLKHHIIHFHVQSTQNSYTAWCTVSALLILSSVLFGYLQKNPLLEQNTRMFFVILFIVTSLLTIWNINKRSTLINVNIIGVYFIVSLILLVSLLNKTTHDLDRNRIELIANEMSIPVDSWLSVLLNNVLDEFSGRETSQLLLTGDEYDISKLAFTRWAKSLLSKEGNNCSVNFYNKSGQPLSEFDVGVRSDRKKPVYESNPPDHRVFFTEERIQNGETIRWYIGLTPVLDDKGDVIGSVRVELIGGRQLLIRSETPEILRSYSGDRTENRYRSLVFSEYIQGKLNNTTADDFPKDLTLPSEVKEKLLKGNGIWYNETIEGKCYDTFFFKDQKSSAEGSWYALSIDAQNTQWDIYSFLRYILLYSILLFVILLIMWLMLFIGGNHYNITFTSKLLIAIISISLVPLILLAFYNRRFANEQAIESTVERLSEQSSIVISELQQELG